MIDRTNLHIEELEEDIRRQNERRYAFYRMLNATDRVLWRLEEMNRDGIKTIPEPMRVEIRDTVEELPRPCVAAFKDSERVQETLDSIFDMQECLFKWRNPDWAVEEGDDLERVAS